MKDDTAEREQYHPFLFGLESAYRIIEKKTEQERIMPMFRWLLLFILVVPALEIGLLVWAGNIIGPLWVVLLIILTGVIGAWLAKQQGLETINNFRQSMANGQVPQDALLDGACILVGGAVLLTPGFITDAIGFLLLLPPTRLPIKRLIRKLIKRMMDRGTITIYPK
ncbi:UPF0716 protein FxsA [Thalassobacillus cyri]|uniref:UPF0716 protein FxsA n=1 Tax=Thalassobacillus cyri TaxID=571932 RepID=A0A1H4BN54_9BACI|nr:UPF0716 protein FxsA [Thalassobacillus cyri]